MPPLMTPGPGFARPPSSSKVRSPSPNYFGFQANSNTLPVSTYEGQHARSNNFSPPSSTVRSTAAMSPSIVPLDQNPDFAAFRRQSEGMGRAFSLASLHNYSHNVSPTTTVMDHNKWPNHAGGTPTRLKSDHKIKSPPRPGPYILDPDAASLGRSPKRHLSSDSSTFPAEARKASPATHGPSEPVITNGELSASPDEEQHPPLFALNPPTFAIPSKPRAATVPAPGGNADASLVSPQHVVNLIDANPEQILILDLRVSTQYAMSRINGALNLCIPTTLMKRPSFTVEKLAETFKSAEQRKKFDNWRSSKYIIVYDASASQVKDATICINTIKKFEKEGYTGIAYIVRGGFAEFAKKFPKYVDKNSGVQSSGMPNKLKLPGEEPLPVIGGCPMPATKQAANPFFGNIRQNMDLIGGVGQMPIKKPSSAPNALDELPPWLQQAADDSNNGKAVSDKFLHIEKREQKRMQDALSGGVSYGTPSSETPSGVKIAGIEKGQKNRYNNIWPFEHTRVKLEDVPNHGCDYVNANHIKSSLSNKRYIATQGPIPATFNDFWNVVWQQDVRVIVMLTAEKEGNQVKAHDYWSDQTYGPFNLSLLSERKATLDLAKIARHRARSSLDRERKTSESYARTSLDNPSRKTSIDNPKPGIVRNDSKGDSTVAPTTTTNPSSDEEPFVTVRKFTLSHSSEPFSPIREITHIQYSSWPDFGAPAHPAHLLGLVEQTDAVVRSLTHTKHNDPDPEGSRQVLVHCSAGCGRTGTFCTVDTVIDVLKRQKQEREKRTRAQREGTPMDVDVKSPVKKESNTLGSPFKGTFGHVGHSASLGDVSSGNPFFNFGEPASSGSQADSKKEAEKRVVEEEKGREWDMDGQWLMEDTTDLIEKTVEDFRHQRLSMVQSLRQFVLCYESVLEWLVEEGKEGKDVMVE
ncbi:protein-tyrosine phosphatase-like protein [Elsinoe australis]|uniref:protein-tyrosine-phosphatase n=1 Tax=Elsinoe australis TaxID=40998 RepID=A0A4U7BE35_9PEZI|nr:protein-tyrosine phosphatase-like protein [Elsinoe australis]